MGKPVYPFSLPLYQKKRRKKTGSWRWRRTETSMSNTFRVFLDVPQHRILAAKGLSTWGTHSTRLESCLCVYMYMYVAPTGQSQSPHKWPNQHLHLQLCHFHLHHVPSCCLVALLFGSPLSLSLPLPLPLGGLCKRKF